MGLLLWSLWPRTAFVPSVRLPAGLSLAEALRTGKGEPPKGWHTNIYCQAGQSASPPGLRARIQELANQIRYTVGHLLSFYPLRIPNPPVVDSVTPRLGECFDTSGEKYLLAKEFVWEVEGQRDISGPYLSFVWGGTNQIRRDAERISVIEDGILNHGIFGLRIRWPLPQQRGSPTLEYLETNRCAVIRDTKGLVKIVPLDCLKGYVDAGLIRLD